MLPKVSVIMRTYNSEKYVRVAIESVLNQDYLGQVELIVCYDEGSTDKTLEIVKACLDSWNIVNRSMKLIKHEHTSPFRALSIYGFSNCTGHYVAFLDYDNMLPRAYIGRVVEYASKNSCQFLFTRAHLIDKNGKDLGRYLFKIPKDFRSLKRIMLRNYIDANTMLVRSDCLGVIAGNLLSLTNGSYSWIHEDWLIGMLATKLFRVDCLNDVEVSYRVHESNLAYSVYIGASRSLHLSNLERDLRTLMAFRQLKWKNLGVLERIRLCLAILEKYSLIFLLKRLIPNHFFNLTHRLFASAVQFLERRI